MTSARFPIPVTEHYVEANGINIWYAEAGQGLPLLLLHGGIVSNGPVWAESEYGWGGQLGRFAEHFRVIAPDTRGHGRTLNQSGVLSYPVFAEDVIALIRALHLEQPLLCGFSDGGITTALVGIMAPDISRAIVNLAGLDMFDPDPDSPSRVMNRTWLGGDPHATRANSAPPDLPPGMQQKFLADFEPTQGAGYVKAYFDQLFDLWTVPMAYTTTDLAKVTAPTLILAGDRETALPVEEAVTAYRTLPRGELGVIPHAEHGITPLACTMALDFLLRHRAAESE
jgi:pimeloyl-ACP methyl ester carboxylesterase